GYDTTIVLPLKPEKRSEIQDEWDELIQDPSVVVFIEGLRELVWETGHKQITWLRNRSGNRVNVEQIVGSKKLKTLRWLIHNSGDAAVATPIDETECLRLSATTAAPRLRCFFPTGVPIHSAMC